MMMVSKEAKKNQEPLKRGGKHERDEAEFSCESEVQRRKESISCSITRPRVTSRGVPGMRGGAGNHSDQLDREKTTDEEKIIGLGNPDPSNRNGKKTYGGTLVYGAKA